MSSTAVAATATAAAAATATGVAADTDGKPKEEKLVPIGHVLSPDGEEKIELLKRTKLPKGSIVRKVRTADGRELVSVQWNVLDFHQFDRDSDVSSEDATTSDSDDFSSDSDPSSSDTEEDYSDDDEETKKERATRRTENAARRAAAAAARVVVPRPPKNTERVALLSSDGVTFPLEHDMLMLSTLAASALEDAKGSRAEPVPAPDKLCSAELMQHVVRFLRLADGIVPPKPEGKSKDMTENVTDKRYVSFIENLYEESTARSEVIKHLWAVYSILPLSERTAAALRRTVEKCELDLSAVGKRERTIVPFLPFDGRIVCANPKLPPQAEEAPPKEAAVATPPAAPAETKGDGKEAKADAKAEVKKKPAAPVLKPEHACGTCAKCAKRNIDEKAFAAVPDAALVARIRERLASARQQYRLLRKIDGENEATLVVRARQNQLISEAEVPPEAAEVTRSVFPAINQLVRSVATQYAVQIRLARQKKNTDEKTKADILAKKKADKEARKDAKREARRVAKRGPQLAMPPPVAPPVALDHDHAAAASADAKDGALSAKAGTAKTDAKDGAKDASKAGAKDASKAGAKDAKDGAKDAAKADAKDGDGKAAPKPKRISEAELRMTDIKALWQKPENKVLVQRFEEALKPLPALSGEKITAAVHQLCIAYAVVLYHAEGVQSVTKVVLPLPPAEAVFDEMYRYRLEEALVNRRNADKAEKLRTGVIPESDDDGDTEIVGEANELGAPFPERFMLHVTLCAHYLDVRPLLDLCLAKRDSLTVCAKFATIRRVENCRKLKIDWRTELFESLNDDE